jgi:hypothetical protein
LSALRCYISDVNGIGIVREDVPGEVGMVTSACLSNDKKSRGERMPLSGGTQALYIPAIGASMVFEASEILQEVTVCDSSNPPN